MQKDHLRPLTAIRFFAAIHVVLYHFAQPQFRAWPVFVRRVLDYGYVGVTMFFVLSGFILAYNYADEQRTLEPRRFWIARFARIYPVYALGLLLGAPAFVLGMLHAPGTAAGVRDFAAALVSSPLLLQSWIPRVAMTWNGPAWSLSVEALFYLVFPLTVPWLIRRRTSELLVLGMAAWALSLAIGAGYLAINPDGLANASVRADDGWWQLAVRVNPLARLPEFLIGVVTGRIFLMRRTESSLATASGLCALGIGLVLLGSPVALPFPLVHDGLLAPIFAVGIFGLASARGRARRVLSWSPLVRLGEASYALYILHVPLHQLSKQVIPLLGLRSEDAPVYVWGYVALALVTSLAVYNSVEVPARAYVRRWLEGRLIEPRPAVAANAAPHEA